MRAGKRTRHGRVSATRNGGGRGETCGWGGGGREGDRLRAAGRATREDDRPSAGGTDGGGGGLARVAPGAAWEADFICKGPLIHTVQWAHAQDRAPESSAAPALYSRHPRWTPPESPTGVPLGACRAPPLAQPPRWAPSGGCAHAGFSAHLAARRANTTRTSGPRPKRTPPPRMERNRRRRMCRGTAGPHLASTLTSQGGRGRLCAGRGGAWRPRYSAVARQLQLAHLGGALSRCAVCARLCACSGGDMLLTLAPRRLTALQAKNGREDRPQPVRQ